MLAGAEPGIKVGRVTAVQLGSRWVVRSSPGSGTPAGKVLVVVSG
jgi:hypothetical protein